MTELILPCHIITVDMTLYMPCVGKKNVLSGHSPTMDRFPVLDYFHLNLHNAAPLLFRSLQPTQYS